MSHYFLELFMTKPAPCRILVSTASASCVTSLTIGSFKVNAEDIASSTLTHFFGKITIRVAEDITSSTPIFKVIAEDMKNSMASKRTRWTVLRAP